MKKSSYQKLKEENLILTRRLVLLALDKNNMETFIVKQKWKMKLELEKSVWYGDVKR